MEDEEFEGVMLFPVRTSRNGISIPNWTLADGGHLSAPTFA